MLLRHLDQVAGALDVVSHRLPGLELQHGDVLVGGGMEDHLGPADRERPFKLPTVPDVCEHGKDLDPGVASFELEVNLIKWALSSLVKSKCGGEKAADLAAQLRADGASGTGYQHSGSLDVGANTLLIELHGFPVKESRFHSLHHPCGAGDRKILLTVIIPEGFVG
jgi:hypothetical protein